MSMFVWVPVCERKRERGGRGGGGGDGVRVSRHTDSEYQRGAKENKKQWFSSAEHKRRDTTLHTLR